MQKAAVLYNRFKNKAFNSGLLKNLFIYSSGAIFLKGISFFLIPLYTRVLAPSDYGFLELLNTVITILNICFSFGLAQVLYIEYFHLDAYEKKKLIFHITTTYTILSIPLFLLALTLLLSFDHLLFDQSVDFGIAFLTIATSFLLFYQGTYFSILQITKQAFSLTINKIVIGVFTGVLNLVLVYYIRMGVQGILISNFTVLGISLAHPAYKYVKTVYSVRFKLEFSQPAKYLKTGFYFILSSLSYWVIAGVDRWILAYYLDEESVGLFSVAYKFSSVYEPLLIAPVLSVYTPYLFEQFSQRKFRQNKMYISVAVLLAFSFLAIINQYFAEVLIDARYHSSLAIIPSLIIGFAFFFLAQIISLPFLYFKKHSTLVWNVVIAGAINIISNVILIRHFGLIGAGIASIISNFAWFLLSVAQNWFLMKSVK